MGPLQNKFYCSGSLNEYLIGYVTCHVMIQQATAEEIEENFGNKVQLHVSDLPIIFKCYIYSERFKYCLTLTEPLMACFERIFSCCPRRNHERHEKDHQNKSSESRHSKWGPTYTNHES